jgi:hypothetical protein
MAKMKRGAQSGKKGGSVVDDELNNPTPKRKNNKNNNKNQKGKKQSKGK